MRVFGFEVVGRAGNASVVRELGPDRRFDADDEVVLYLAKPFVVAGLGDDEEEDPDAEAHAAAAAGLDLDAEDEEEEERGGNGLLLFPIPTADLEERAVEDLRRRTRFPPVLEPLSVIPGTAPSGPGSDG